MAESTSRPEGDPYWNYLKFFDNIRPYIWMKPIGNFLYECVYLAGHPALTTSNSNEPPGSFHSKDIFEPHPTIPNRWKYASRLDDRVTLLNGEKVLPLPIEGLIKQNSLVHDAVVVGIGKATPGLVLLRSQEAENLEISNEEYLQKVWPTIEDANSRAERFSQISMDMVAVLPFTAEFPRTDKGSMIRPQVYLQYVDLIENMYLQAEKASGRLQLIEVETESFLMRFCRDQLQIPLSNVDANFFEEGIDSLKAIQLRRLILQNFYFQKEGIGLNMVYEAGNIKCLARTICALQQGKAMETSEDGETTMLSLIRRYSNFERHTPFSVPKASSRCVILTGATGSIGAHILYELLKDDSIATVFCLTRQKSPRETVLQSLIDKDLHLSVEQVSRVTALSCTLDQPRLGLDQDIFNQLQNSTTHIIHAAWPVNFHLPLSGFEPHIRGLHNLIQLSLSVRQSHPAVLLFCSSISTILRSPIKDIPESTAKLCDAYMGYGQSKLVGEQIVNNAHQTGAHAYSLRIGQVSGHSKKGLWNDSEALPLLIRSVLTLKSLPDLDQSCNWLPVDTLASSIVEIAQACVRSGAAEREEICNTSGEISKDLEHENDSVYNICNPHDFSWSSMLSTLRKNGFQFETVSFKKWLRLLRESEKRGEEHINPAVKLIDHYEAMYGDNSQLGPKSFRTEKAERDSLTLRNGRVRIIDDGILNCYVRDWLNRWLKA